MWTTNLAAFLLGAGHVCVVHRLPAVRAAADSTGFGFGASVVVSGLYLLPSTIGMTVARPLRRRDLGALRLARGAARRAPPSRRRRSRCSRSSTATPIDLLLAAGLLGVGIGLAFAALGNLIIQAVPSHQTGVASGMNTVMRTLGGALGGQLSATFIAAHTIHGEPAVTGFTETFVMATAFSSSAWAPGCSCPSSSAGGSACSTAARRPPRHPRAPAPDVPIDDCARRPKGAMMGA